MEVELAYWLAKEGNKTKFKEHIRDNYFILYVNKYDIIQDNVICYYLIICDCKIFYNDFIVYFLSCLFSDK